MSQLAQATPTQPRAKKTYEALLEAAQNILAEDGYDALNSNAIVKRAKLTPPAFYRYFRDKHMILCVLAQRLLDAQNELVDPILTKADRSFWNSIDATEKLLNADINLTRGFTASGEILVLMRALPELREIRLATQQRMSTLLAEATRTDYPHLTARIIRTRTLLATNIYFSTLEMLFETDFRNQKEIVRRTSIAVQAAISLADEQ